MAYLSLSPVSVGVYNLLNVAGMTALVGTRIYDDVPQAPTFPFLWYEVRENKDMRGFGTGAFPEVEIQLHAFSQYEGAKEAQDITAKGIELLRDQPLSVTGYAQAGRIFYDPPAVLLPNEIIAGVKCREMVARFRTYVEETSGAQPLPWVQSGWIQ